MAKTPFDQYNYDFSDRCHLVARNCLYPSLRLDQDIPISSDEMWVNMGGTPDDLNRGIDRIVTYDNCATLDGVALNVVITIQERFRRSQYAHYRQLTATDVNAASGSKGDFHKLEADLYTYGYINEEEDGFIEAVIVDIPILKSLYRTGAIEPTRNYYRRKQQIILGFDFDKLEQGGAILVHLKRNGQIQTRHGLQ